MKRAPRFRNLALCAWLGAGVMGGLVQAREARLEIETVTTAIGRIDALELTLDWPDGANEGALAFEAKALDAGELGYRFRDLRWTCPLRREADDRWHCEGPLRARGHGAAVLRAESTAGVVRLALSQARGQFAVVFPAQSDEPMLLRGMALPLTWLQPMLNAAWAEGRITGGTLDAELSLRRPPSGGTDLRGPVTLHALGLDSSNGRIATASLDIQGQFALGLAPDHTRVDVSGQLLGGELLLGPLYSALPETPIDVELDLRSQGDTHWQLERLRWKDAGVLELDAAGVVDRVGSSPLSELDARLAAADLQLANTRYFGTLLGTFGLSQLQAGGRLQGRASMRDAAPVAIEVEATDVDLLDGAGRFAVEGLDGDLRWSARDAIESQLRWRRARVHDLVFGAAALPWRSVERRLELRVASALPLFDGALNLTRFSWTPRDSARGTALDLALDLRDVDLAQLSPALGWPAFPGRLSGTIPGARYADEVLSLEGGLDADVFAGRVRIGALTLERPFGVAPTLSAAVDFERLDLQPLTAAFGFGEITGRLDGKIHDLRVVDWSPVAFDADLHTSPGAKGPRRISQRAVNDLSRVGGGGFVAGLQSQVLKLFETFGYSRIGLKCRLANNVCHMDGVDSSRDGYTIVEGSGLPRITVIGHQRQVDWPVLVARLKAATEGQTPIVN